MEKQYVNVELNRFLITGYEYVDYLRDAVNGRLDKGKDVYKSPTIDATMQIEDIVPALVRGTFSPAHLFGAHVWVVDNNLDFIYDGSLDKHFDGSKGPVNLFDDYLTNSHYKGEGLKEIGEKIKQGIDGGPEDKIYYLWDDENGNVKEYAVWAIIPKPGHVFEGGSTFWAVVLPIKESAVFEHYKQLQVFLYASVFIFILLIWASAIFMVVVYSKSIR